MFHGGDFDYWVDGDLDFSVLRDEEVDDLWVPITDFENLCGLFKITAFLLTKECAWEYTANHPDELLLE